MNAGLAKTALSPSSVAMTDAPPHRAHAAPAGWLARLFRPWRAPRYAARTYRSAEGLPLFYRDYMGGGAATPVLCIPGLTRNARDFDSIAGRLARTRRVLVADLRGRGRSAYDPDWRHYQVNVEAADMIRLLDHAGVRRAVVLGTSRGGIVGMVMAATRPGTVAGLILNDIGAEIEAAGLARILDGLGKEGRYRSWEAAGRALAARYAAHFPNLRPAHWRRFARALYRREAGEIVPDYDPKLADAMRSGPKPQGANVNLWPLFMGVRTVPALVLRGANSDLLSAATVAKMTAFKPDLAAITVANRGHVPFLDEPEAVAGIAAMLARIS